MPSRDPARQVRHLLVTLLVVATSATATVSHHGLRGAEPNEAGEGGAHRAARFDAGAFERQVAQIDDRAATAARVEVTYAVGHREAVFEARVAAGVPLLVRERIDLDRGAVRELLLHYADGALLRYRSCARTYADAGAPSDGWYERMMTMYFAGKRYAGGEGTINGRPAELDEHEVRAAWREAEAIKARLANRPEAPPE